MLDLNLEVQVSGAKEHFLLRDGGSFLLVPISPALCNFFDRCLSFPSAASHFPLAASVLSPFTNRNLIVSGVAKKAISPKAFLFKEEFENPGIFSFYETQYDERGISPGRVERVFVDDFFHDRRDLTSQLQPFLDGISKGLNTERRTYIFQCYMGKHRSVMGLICYLLKGSFQRGESPQDIVASLSRLLIELYAQKLAHALLFADHTSLPTSNEREEAIRFAEVIVSSNLADVFEVDSEEARRVVRCANSEVSRQAEDMIEETLLILSKGLDEVSTDLFTKQFIDELLDTCQ